MRSEQFSRTWPELFVPKARLAHNVVVTSLGPAYSRGMPLAETYYRYPYSVVKGALVSLASLVRHRPVSVRDATPFAIVHSQWTRGYYHWLTEALPRALAAQEADPLMPVLLPRSYNTFQPASLEFLGIPYEQFPAHNLRLKAAYVTSCAKHYGTTAPTVLNNLRRRFSQHLNVTKFGSRRFYISRRQARGRMVLNEAEVLQILAKFGYEEIVAEDHGFASQVQLFSEASSIISIHGAGLTNMLFMPGNGTILEILPYRNGIFDFRPNTFSFRHDNCYLILSSALGHKYESLQCMHDRAQFSRTNLANLIVDLDELESKVQNMLIES